MGKGLAIIGAGGFGREAYFHALAQLNRYGSQREIRFFADDEYATGDIHPLSNLDPDKWAAIIAIGDPKDREAMANRLPSSLMFDSIQHPSTHMMDVRRLGHGSIICAGAVVTTNVYIGRHVHVNLNATIGHDCIIGDYVTIAPSANLSGNVTIGAGCYIGTNAAITATIVSAVCATNLTAFYSNHTAGTKL